MIAMEDPGSHAVASQSSPAGPSAGRGGPTGGRRHRTGQPRENGAAPDGSRRLVYLLAALCLGAIAVAVLVVGAPSSQTTGLSRVVTASRGVVQATVSGTGNLQAVNQLDLGFKTAGTVTSIHVSQGQHVNAGQLVATLDPQSAEVTLEQSRASLQAAEANLAREEETNGEGSTGTGASAGSTGGGANISYAAERTEGEGGSESGHSTPEAGSDTGATGDDGSSAHSGSGTAGSGHKTGAGSGSLVSGSSSGGSGSFSGQAATSLSPATREANLASARAAVRSAKLGVQSDEAALQDTRLYAPESGTIVSLSGQVGEVVSGGGTTRSAGSSASSSSSTGSGGTGSSSSARSGGDGAASGGTSSAASSSNGSSGSGSTFAILSNLSSMELVVPLSESEIGDVRVGQIATVTVEALEGRKLAARVSEVATLPTSSSGVVSYDVTFQLDQMESGLKPGMSATAEVVVRQAEGVNVPTTAITGGTVTVVENGKDVRRRVATGLAGNSTTIILSGLQAGEQVRLPIATSTQAGGAGLRRGGLGLALGGGLGGGGGRSTFLRGPG